MIETLNNFVWNPVTIRRWVICGNWNAAASQIKKFVFLDLAGGRTMCATNVVRQDFKARHRVRFRVVAQKEIAHLLGGIGEMSMRLDPDISPPNNVQRARSSSAFL